MLENSDSTYSRMVSALCCRFMHPAIIVINTSTNHSNLEYRGETLMPGRKTTLIVTSLRGHVEPVKLVSNYINLLYIKRLLIDVGKLVSRKPGILVNPGHSGFRLVFFSIFARVQSLSLGIGDFWTSLFVRLFVRSVCQFVFVRGNMKTNCC